MTRNLASNSAPLLLAGVLALPGAAVAQPAAPAAASTTSIPARPAPPVAAVRPHPLTIHGQTRNDVYYWLRDDSRTDADVLDYLKAENAYTEALLAHTKPLQEKLFQEIVGRIQQDDSTVPTKDGAHWYLTRYAQGQEYPIFARRQGAADGPEQVLLDANQLAQGHSFYQVGGLEVSADGNLLAWAEDTVSRRLYTVRFKNLRTGEVYADVLANASTDLAWANDNRTLFWVEKDPTTLLPYRVRRHVLGTDPARDAVVYEEKDNTFYTSVYKSASKRYVVISLGSTLSSEFRLLDADQPAGDFWVFLPREHEHEYDIEDCGNRFLVRTNWRARNFRIVEVEAGRHAEKSAWRDVVAHRDDAFVHGFQCFRGFLAVSERSGGLRKIRIKPWAANGAAARDHLLTFDEAAYVARLGDNREQDTDLLRYSYTSLTTPRSTYELDMKTGERRLLKRDPVLGGFDPANYATEYLHAPARDGARVPVSVVYRKGFRRDGQAPLYLTAYGSYGSSREPEFSAARLSLVDRGFVVAIAHVRGGQELGRKWYEDGKLLKKKNTFYDFIDATEHLVREKYGAADKVMAAGGSAGGLLMGAIANLRPDLYRAIVAAVPFVDVVTTMLDESIPLTTGEFDEWGDPKQRAYYDYMLSYSPYDQVARHGYPALLVTTGLWDSQVQYYEPAKWVAKLRAVKTDANPLLLWVNMDAGHGGASGRFRRHRETALEYAFLLDLLGMGS